MNAVTKVAGKVAKANVRNVNLELQKFTENSKIQNETAVARTEDFLNTAIDKLNLLETKFNSLEQHQSASRYQPEVSPEMVHQVQSALAKVSKLQETYSREIEKVRESGYQSAPLSHFDRPTQDTSSKSHQNLPRPFSTPLVAENVHMPARDVRFSGNSSNQPDPNHIPHQNRQNFDHSSVNICHQRPSIPNRTGSNYGTGPPRRDSYNNSYNNRGYSHSNSGHDNSAHTQRLKTQRMICQKPKDIPKFRDFRQSGSG